jgi:hypothetical protein
MARDESQEVSTVRPPKRRAELARIAVGLIWLAGALFNAIVTMRMADPFSWLAEGSRFSIWRTFFRETVSRHPRRWTVLLIAGEAALGLLTLGKGKRARIGLAGGSLFSAGLFSLGTSYSTMMGPYTLLLVWLTRFEFGQSIIDILRRIRSDPAHGQEESRANSSGE